MRYIIIGLGNYGGVLAEELSALGNEVIGVDNDANRVDCLKDKIATAFVIDATDQLSLSVLPLNEVDVVIVAIGENFGASVRVVALLKQRKVKHIYARAVDEVHRAVLQAFMIDKVLTPENDAARALVQFIEIGVRIESFQVDEEYYVMKFQVPVKLVGYRVNELNLDKDFNIKIIALKRSDKVVNCLGISILESEVQNLLPEDYEIVSEDELVCYGRYKDFQSLWKAL